MSPADEICLNYDSAHESREKFCKRKKKNRSMKQLEYSKTDNNIWLGGTPWEGSLEQIHKLVHLLCDSD